MVDKDTEGIPKLTEIVGYSKSKIPIIKAYRKPPHLIFWCAYCKKFHYHGLAGGEGSGHRCAHCFTSEGGAESIFNEKGYYILDFEEENYLKIKRTFLKQEY